MWASPTGLSPNGHSEPAVAASGVQVSPVSAVDDLQGVVPSAEGADVQEARGGSSSPSNGLGLRCSSPTQDQASRTTPKRSTWVEQKMGTTDSVTVENGLPEPEDHRCPAIAAFVRSSLFSSLTTGLIVVNGIIIGIETEHNDGSALWTSIEMIFLVCYTVELVLRVVAEGLEVFKYDDWIRFDGAVLFIAYLDLCILGPVMDGKGEAQQLAMVLRIIRLLKLARLVRLFRFFKELWLLVTSFMAAFKTLWWTLILLVIVLYVFGILFVKLLGDVNEDEEIQEWFGSLPASMFTLFQIMTLEGWSDIARAVWATDQWFMCIAICAVIFLCTFAIMNTVMAVIVQHTLGEAIDQREDMAKKAQAEFNRVATDLIQIFHKADTDRSGMLSLEEFVGAMADPAVMKLLQGLDLGSDIGLLDAEGVGVLFEIIDVDSNNELHPQEFIDGMMHMRGEARARSIFELHMDVQKKHKVTEKKVQHLVSMQEHANSRIRDVESAIETGALSQRSAVAALERKVDTLAKSVNAIADNLGVGPPGGPSPNRGSLKSGLL